MRFSTAAIAVAALCSGMASADTRPDSHAPISVMGDHLHKQGELMFSYRYMHVSMQDNSDGSSDLSPQQIVTTEPNPFANPPLMPPTLRVVPLEMTMDMHMLGLMYAPTDRVTLMGMVNYLDKEMDHLTYMGPAGTTPLGKFTTRTSGFGDTSIAALIRLGEGSSSWHATVGVSLPTGDIDETDTVDADEYAANAEVALPNASWLGNLRPDRRVDLCRAHRALGLGQPVAQRVQAG